MNQNNFYLPTMFKLLAILYIMIDVFLMWDNSFSAYQKFSQKLTFLTPPPPPLIRTRTGADQGVRHASFSENFAYMLN